VGTFYTRVGAASEAGASSGASVNIARVSTSDAEATQAGQVFSQQGASFFQPGARVNSSGVVTDAAEEPPSVWDKIGGAVSGVGRPIIRALEWGTEATGNLMEASLRTAEDRTRDGFHLGDVVNGLTASPIWGWTQDDWRENWGKAVDAQASVGQTAWLLAEQRGNELGWWDAGTSGTDPTRSGGLDLLDNPNRLADRKEYFSEGAAHWTTGIGDAMWQVFADPLFAAGKAAAGVRTSRAVLGLEDVARAADPALDAAALTSRQGRARNLVHDTAVALDASSSQASSVSTLARSPWLRHSSDGGSIAYFASRAGEGIDDVAERIAAREDVFYAGMGDAAAMERVGLKSLSLRVELEKKMSDLGDLHTDDILSRTDLTDADAVAQAHARLNDTALARRELEAQSASIRASLDAAERVLKVGAPISGNIAQVGGLATLKGTRNTAKVVSSFQNGQFLDRVHIVSGQHLPGTFQLSADNAGETLHAAVLRARVLLPRKDPRFAEFAERLVQHEDDFMRAGTGAQSKGARGNVMTQFDKTVDDMVAYKYGQDPDAISAVYNRMRARRGAEVQNVASRAYRAIEAGELPAVRLEDGTYVFDRTSAWIQELGRPTMRSQVADFVSIVDPTQLDRVAKAHFGNGMGGYVAKVTTSGAWEISEAALAGFNRAWKFGALLRPVAYLVRAQADTQGRQLANLAALKYVSQASRGAYHTIFNLKKVDISEARALNARFYASQRIDDLDRILTQGDLADDVAAPLRRELVELNEHVSRPVKFTPDGRMIRVRETELSQRIGKSARIDRSGKYTPSKIGDAYRSNDEFLRKINQMDSEDSITGLIVGSTRGQIDASRRSGRWDVMPGQNTGWEGAYLRGVNRQIRSDELGQRILAGETDEDILRWFHEPGEGSAYLRDMRATGTEAERDVVERARDHVLALLPEDSAIRAAAQSRDVTLADIKAAWAVPSLRPGVPGELLEKNLQAWAPAAYKAFERKYFHWVAQMPENMMGRHPFYTARFEMHAKQIMANADMTFDDAGKLTLQQVNDVRVLASQNARKDIARYLFDTSQQSSVGHAVRFMSPFYGAWEDTITKWGRIFGEKPQAAVGFWKAMRSPNAAGWVVDQDGNPIDVYGNVRNDQGEIIGQTGIWDGYMLLPIPDWSLPGVGSLHEWAGSDKLRIAKNAANVVFQGDPWFLPGPGPILAVPANEMIVKWFPEAWGEEGKENFILKYLLPFGPSSDSVPQQVMPSWARAAMDVVSQDGRRVDGVFTQLYQEQVNMERNGQAEVTSDAERMELVGNRVRNWTLLRLMGTQMPMSFSPQSRLSYYKDEYNRYRREYGAEADDKFAADYPDYYDMAISLTANETGLTATDESWGAVQSYRNDMAQNPKYGWFWAGASNMSEGWSQGVYQSQLRQEIGPGTSTTFRSRKDPLEAARDASTQQGWRDYQQVSTQLRLAMEERGLTSFSSKGAADLATIREQFVAKLSQRNPQWAADFNDGGNPGKVTEFLTLAATQFASHPELLEREDGQSIATYLMVRDQMKAAMAERGSSSIDSQSNADLKVIWDAFTSQLIQQDLGFEQAWDRVLSRDDLSGDTYAGGEG